MSAPRARLSPAVEQALQEIGAVFVRRNKHLVFRLPNGHNIVISCTPSDHRAERNKLKELRRRAAEPRRA